MKPLLSFSLILFSLLLSLSAHADIKIENAWIRLLPPVAKSTAAYLDIHSSSDDVLISISCDLAQMCELHKTSMEDGMMNMSHIDQLTVPANQTVHLSPGSHHIMLMGLAHPLESQQQHQLTLKFKHAGEVTVTVPVR